MRSAEITGTAAGEKPGVGMYKPHRHTWLASERKQQLAAPENLIGRHPVVGESYLHKLWLFSVVVLLSRLGL